MKNYLRSWWRCLGTILFMLVMTGAYARIFKARFAGQWYPDDKKELISALETCFSSAATSFCVPSDAGRVRAFIAPHAGMIYSGLCAATVFQTLRETAGKNTRVILFAPSHHWGFKGIALLGGNYTRYRTPLGDIKLENTISKQLARKKTFFYEMSSVFETEHAVEVELPFLQYVIKEFSLLPLVVGSLEGVDLVELAHLLMPFIDEHTVVVVSSDFVHYGQTYDYTPFAHAIHHRIRQLDARIIHTLACQSLADFEAVIAETKATVCGKEPLRLLLALLAQNACGPVASYLTCYYGSLQMVRAREAYGKELFSIEKLFHVGPMKRSENNVSYVGMVYATADQGAMADISLTGYEKKALLKSARAIIENSFLPKSVRIGEELFFPPMSQALSRPSGVFVTLKKNGDLRGCIGCTTGCLPRYAAVQELALSAAFHDARFAPLKENEQGALSVDISLLTEPQNVSGYEAIVVGKHGVEMEKEGHKAVFLPQVAIEQGWDRTAMLQQLSLKAGLPRDAWQQGAQFKVFEGFELKEG